MKINDIFEGDVIQGPWKQKSKVKPISQMKQIPIHHVFGGSEYNQIRDVGFKFVEKPSYFGDIFDEYSIPKTKLGQIQNVIGHKLTVYDMSDILQLDDGRRPFYVPLSKFKMKPAGETFIVRMTDEVNYIGDEADDFIDDEFYFLCNVTGAQSYIRMWAFIDPHH